MKKMFAVLWRLTILALPWQTRWFVDASLSGWPWEQGRWSVYISFGLLAVTCIVGLIAHWSDIAPRLRFSRPFALALVGFVLISICAAVFLPEPARRVPAIAQWWIQIGLLGLFAWILSHIRVSRVSIATMFVIALVPEIGFGLWQFAVQHVDAMKWLGVAAQDPRQLGVSVVEYDIYRYLRVYGGFPHPNIFGGWLAAGALVSAWLAAVVERKAYAYAYVLMTALCSVTLLLTFARSAWIAVLIGFVLLAVALLRRSDPEREVSVPFFWLAVISALLLTGVIAVTQRRLLLSRVESSQRLEVKSLDERKQSLVDGVTILKQRPWFGTGPNAELLDLAAHQSKERTLSPLQPPHSAYLMFLDAFGIAGILLCSWLIFASRAFLRTIVSRRFWLIAPLSILALFDHYLFSAWPGEALVLLVFLMA